MKTILLTFLLIALPSSVSCEEHPAADSIVRSRIQDALFHSRSLGRDVHYRVLLPAHYDDGGRFPVLYLLHGLYGDYLNWDTRTGLENYAANLHLLIVM